MQLLEMLGCIQVNEKTCITQLQIGDEMLSYKVILYYVDFEVMWEPFNLKSKIIYWNGGGIPWSTLELFDVLVG